ncbi:PF20097 family protein [Oscillibacter ruminantium]|uniref:PF20097 family protein n=1 Tax=Oscillibacter ruminantium TaxID=1263547 RepID=UPI00331789DB
MAFWNRDDEGEWEKYQKSRGKQPQKPPQQPQEPQESCQEDAPSFSDEFRAYFKTVRQARPAESSDATKPNESGLTARGMLDSFISSFKPDHHDKPEEPESPPEKCPWCGKDMQKGYLSGGRDGARWSAETPGLLVSTVSIQDEGGWLDSAYKVCWFCKDCQKIFFDTANLDAPLGTKPLSDSILNTLSDAEKMSYAVHQGCETAPPDHPGEPYEETEKGE